MLFLSFKQDCTVEYELEETHWLYQEVGYLLLLSSSSSSSSSPLCRVFILTFLRQTMSLRNTVLQLFCCYYSRCLYRQFQCWIYCTFTLVLSAVCVQYPIWLFSVVPWLHVFLLCCSRLLLLILFVFFSHVPSFLPFIIQAIGCWCSSQ